MINNLPRHPQAAEELVLAKVKPVLSEESKALTDVSRIGSQLGNGGFKTIQTGQKFRVFQELYCTPSRKTLRLIVLTNWHSRAVVCPRDSLSLPHVQSGDTHGRLAKSWLEPHCRARQGSIVF